VLAGIVLFIGLALVKPWQSPTEVATLPDSPSPTPATTSPSPTVATGSPSTDPGLGEAKGPPDVLTWQDALPWVLRDHADWGIRAVVLEPGPHGMPAQRSTFEVWQLAFPRDTDVPQALDTAGRIVVALGVTTPPTQRPLDVRLWRYGDDGLEFMPAEQMAVPGQAVPSLLVPPRSWSGPRAWPGGRYRLDALVAGNVVRIDFDVPTATPAQPPGPGGGSFDVPPDRAIAVLAAEPFGAYELVAMGPNVYRATCLDGRPGPSLEGVAAWLDLTEAQPPDPDGCTPGEPSVPAHALGLRLGDGDTITGATLVRLEPEPSEAYEGVVDGNTAIFAASIGRAWSAGTYRIDARWRSGGDRKRGSFVLDLYPGWIADPLLLQAARRATVLAHEWKIVGGLIASPVAQEPGLAPTDTRTLGSKCEGGTMVAPESVVMVGHPWRRSGGASVWRLFADGSMTESDAIVVTDAPPGAVLFAPASDSVWRPGYYAIILDGPRLASFKGSRATLVFCVGMYEPNGLLAVPPHVDQPPDLRIVRPLPGTEP
jgi:hypothetical protein